MFLLARKRKNRTVIDALLLEENFSEETLKNENALQRARGPLGFLRES